MAPIANMSANLSGSATVSAVGALRMQFTGQNLMAAAHFSRRVREIEAANAGQPFGAFFDEILWNASASVILAASAIETHLNEIIADRDRHFPKHAPVILTALWKAKERGRLFDKFDLALMLREAPPLDFKAEPARGMASLVTLRNELVHFKPEWSNEAVVHKRVSSKLAKIQPSPFLPGEALFPRAWATHTCTRWAVETALAFGSSIAKHFDQKNVFDQFAGRAVP